MWGNKEKTKELATAEPQTNNSAAVMGMLQNMTDKGATPEALEKLVSLQRSIVAFEAEQSYAEAMYLVQSEVPKIKANVSNERGNKYANLEQINSVVVPLYTRHGFSLSFGSGDAQLDGWIRITCDVRHRGGHKEHYFYDLPVDDVGPKGERNKTAVQGVGSSTSYGRRYLTNMIFNVTIGDDNDGNGPAAGNEPITDAQFKQMNKAADDAGVDKAAFCEHFGIDSMNELPMNQFNNALRAIAAKKQRGASNG